MNQIVMFRLNNLYYGMDIIGVNEIVNTMPVTELPNKPAHIKGIVQFRNHIYTIVNGHQLLGLKESNEDKSQLIFLANGYAGILVDEVLEIIDVTESNKQSLDNLTMFDNMDNLQYVVEHGDKMITVIDIEKMVFPSNEDELVNEITSTKVDIELLDKEKELQV